MSILETKSHHQPSADVDHRGFLITVMSAVGAGQTPLSAFDAALHRCGVESYNLLVLSSVIPPSSEVVVCDRYQAPGAEYGHKLYVVKAEMRSHTHGAVIAAGLGWWQHHDGRGVFVEHEAAGEGVSPAEMEEALTVQITASLRDLARVRGVALTPNQVRMHVVSTRVESLPACALVVAVYQSEGWRGAARSEGSGR